MSEQPLHKIGFLEFHAEYPPAEKFGNPAEELNWMLEHIRYRPGRAKSKRMTKPFVAGLIGVTTSAVESWLKPYRGSCRADLGRDMPPRMLLLLKLELGLQEPFWMLTGGEPSWNVRTAGSEKQLPDELKVKGQE